MGYVMHPLGRKGRQNMKYEIRKRDHQVVDILAPTLKTLVPVRANLRKDPRPGHSPGLLPPDIPVQSLLSEGWLSKVKRKSHAGPYYRCPGRSQVEGGLLR